MREPGAGADAIVMLEEEGRAPLRLTHAQAEFAAAHGAEAGCTDANGTGVFFYRKGESYTERWLVARNGAILDLARFEHAD